MYHVDVSSFQCTPWYSLSVEALLSEGPVEELVAGIAVAVLVRPQEAKLKPTAPPPLPSGRPERHVQKSVHLHALSSGGCWASTVRARPSIVRRIR